MQRAARTECKDNHLASIINEGGDTVHRQETWRDLQKAQDLMACVHGHGDAVHCML